MKNISVIGSGTMGNGIAHVFAQYDYNVSRLLIFQKTRFKRPWQLLTRIFHDKWKREALRKKRKSRHSNNITTHTVIKSGIDGAELIVEAASENIDLKLKIFQELDASAGPEMYTGFKHVFHIHHQNCIRYQTT